MKIKFISVDNNKKLYQKYILDNTFVKNNKHITCVRLDNTKENIFISKQYNQFIDKYDFKEESWFVFCHNDWEIKEDIALKLNNLDKNKLWGNIGTFLYKNNQGVLIREYRGQCYEKKRDGTNERLLQCHKTATGTEVNSFDCQCLIVHSSLIQKYNLRFDENLEFDLYIEDFCINAKIKHNIKSSILQLKSCHHSQVDDILLRPSYGTMLTYLNTKYKDHLFSGVVSMIGSYEGLYFENITPNVIYKDRTTIYQNKVGNANDPRRYSIDWILGNTKTLDVGCACGDFGVAITSEKDVKIWGFEYNIGSVEIAKKLLVYEDVFQVDLNTFDPENYKLFFNSFDYIVLSDVLEHLINPEQTLNLLKKFLKENGRILISLPNIAHASIKSNLLLNNFDYTPYGILDTTHLRFFTYKTIAKFLSDCGLKIDDIKYTTVGKRGTQQNNPYPELPRKVKKFILQDKHSFVCQYVVNCEQSNEIKIDLHNLNILGNVENIDIKKYKTPKWLRKLISLFNNQKM